MHLINQEHIVRVDELSSMLEAARAAVAQTIDSAYPALLLNTQESWRNIKRIIFLGSVRCKSNSNLQELISLFRAIDASEAAAIRVGAAVAAAGERLVEASSSKDYLTTITAQKSAKPWC